ncbi:hypothetical protein [uncultured Clostridium sp.]|uniref:hypothetical protein n=1 Tax=uncultured Clostridium sp. TaxID=59620 RepID=UPI0028EF2077|nr:hypothetical protein [uncultured Clostridium sp.]
MKTVKILVIVLFPMFLLYLLNILIFNKYPMFLGSFCGSAIYSKSLLGVSSYSKVVDNLLEKEKKKLSAADFINLLLVFSITFLFTFLIYLLFNNGDLGYPFWATSFVFAFMAHFKIPKRFFS